jgi:hypothetical protein
MGGPEGKGGSKVHQDQTASNENSTYQTAQSEASNQQENVNAPFSLLSFGSNSTGFDPCGCEGKGGGVKQTNNANTSSEAENNNGTGQTNNQTQKGSAS